MPRLLLMCHIRVIAWTPCGAAFHHLVKAFFSHGQHGFTWRNWSRWSSRRLPAKLFLFFKQLSPSLWPQPRRRWQTAACAPQTLITGRRRAFTQHLYLSDCLPEDDQWRTSEADPRPGPHSLHILRKQKSPKTSSAAPNWIRGACTYMSCVGNWDPEHPCWNNRNRNTHSRAL